MQENCPVIFSFSRVLYGVHPGLYRVYIDSVQTQFKPGSNSGQTQGNLLRCRDQGPGIGDQEGPVSGKGATRAGRAN